MRERQRRLIIAFHTTTEAMAAEACFKKDDLPGRMIPVPAQVRAGCGLAWMALPEEKDRLLAAAARSGLIYEIVDIYWV